MTTIALRPRQMRICRHAAAAALSLLLIACGGGGGGDGDGGAPAARPSHAELQLDALDPAIWEIGPIVRGLNYSRGMPLQPSPPADASAAGWVIELPAPTADAGSVHYVTMPAGSLAGMTRVRMRFRVEADPGVRIAPRTAPTAPAILTLYFQREGDDWSARGEYEAFRWYATFASHLPIQPGGEYTVDAPFDQNWTAVLASSRKSNPAAFQQALAGAGRIGFVLGGGDGYGHGVFATGRARIVVTAFEVD